MKLNTPIPLPENEKARNELFELLGWQGGTWTQVNEALQVTRRNRRSCRFRFGEYEGVAGKYGVVILRKPGEGGRFILPKTEEWFRNALGGHIASWEEGWEAIYEYR